MSPSPDQPSTASGKNPTQQPEFSPEDRALLLQLAHESLASAFEGRELAVTVPPHLGEPRGVFTTLYRDGELRGCVGFAFAASPLYRAVMETARAAAFDDRRFPPLSREELPRIRISLSILARPQPIRPEDVEVGRHGLLISRGGQRGLLLPQVPLEHGWDRTTFLEQTCRKAGLPEDAWRSGATVEGFTAEVFGDQNT
jgi:AmmeMemoRadiSam system protein A